MNEDNILYLIEDTIAESLDFRSVPLSVNTELVSELGFDDESFEFFLIDLKDLIPNRPDLTSLVLGDIGTIGDLFDAIVDVVCT